MSARAAVAGMAPVPVAGIARAAVAGIARVAIALIALTAVDGGGALAQQPDLGTDEQRAAGKRLYDKYCSQCHGDTGDGRGVATPYLKPEPRDLTSGKYKIRTTPSGALPTDQDLKNIIRRGMPYTSMPAWPQFTESQLTNLVYYVKTFSEDFADPEYVATGMTVPKPPAMTEETVAAGRKVYEELGCIRCHGELGRGDGMSAPTLVDDWGNHIRAADLTAKWTFRGGATRADLFRTMTTGINGTPMPSYADALSDEERWNLVDYVYSLSDSEQASYAELVRVSPLDDPLDLERGAELFAGAQQARFPLIGQIVQPGRSTHPLVTDVRVRAVYNSEEIAFLVEWNDLIADDAGRNDPTLVVPRIDPAAAGAAAGDDFWGEGQAAADEGDFWGEEQAADDAGDFWGEEAAADEGDFWGEEGAEAAPASRSTSEWSDAVALQLPTTLPTGIQKPYFLLGDPLRPVDLWFVDLAQKEPQQFVARGSASVVPVEGTEVSTVATYDNGQWSVIFKRPLRALEGVTFAEEQFVPIAFSVWDGFNDERGNKRALTRWFYAYVEPREQRSAVGPVIRAVLIVLAIELLVIFLVRWRHRRGPSAVGDERAALA